jgi:hypothetical protein
MPGTFKSRRLTGWEHAHAPSSSIGALFQCNGPAGSFLMDRRGEISFADTAGAVGGSGIAMVASTTGLSGSRSIGWIDDIGSSWRRSVISAEAFPLGKLRRSREKSYSAYQHAIETAKTKSSCLASPRASYYSRLVHWWIRNRKSSVPRQFREARKPTQC